MDIQAIYSDVASWLVVWLIAATPFLELRTAVPVGLVAMQLPAVAVLLAAGLGGLTPFLLVYGVGHHVTHYFRRKKRFVRDLKERFLHPSRRELRRQYAKWGLLALSMLIALPLPVAGTWTAAIAAYAFRMPFWKALPFFLLGVVVALALVFFAANGAMRAVDGIAS